MVNHSTPQSRKDGVVSLQAIIETIVLVLLVLGVTIYTDTTIYLLTSILIAPLLLLKSPRSIALSHKLFLHEPKIDEKHPFFSPLVWVALLVSAILSYLVVSWLVEYWHLGAGGWRDFGYGLLIAYLTINISLAITVGFISVVGAVVVGAVVVGGVVGAVVVGGVVGVVIGVIVGDVDVGVVIGVIVISVIGVSFAVGFAVGFLIRSIVIKIISTIYTLFSTNPFKTLEYITINYREQLWVNDLWYAPELLPEISTVDKFYSLSSYLKWKEQELEYKITNLFIIPIWSLAYLYRLSIKSTAWFYFPLAFLATSTTKSSDKDGIKKSIDIQTDLLYVSFNSIISVILFIALFGTVFKEKIIELVSYAKNVYDFLDLIKTIDIPIVYSIWSGYLLIIATLIYWAVWYFSYIQKKHISNDNAGHSELFNLILFWLLRLRMTLWMVAFFLTLYASYDVYHSDIQAWVMSIYN